jgi:hypothetical protein
MARVSLSIQWLVRIPRLSAVPPSAPDDASPFDGAQR